MSPAGCYLALSRFGCPRRGRIPCLERLRRDERFDNSFAGPAAGACHGAFHGSTTRRPASPRWHRHPRGQHPQTSTARQMGPGLLLGARGEALQAANNFDRTSRNTMLGASGTTDCRSPGRFVTLGPRPYKMQTFQRGFVCRPMPSGVSVDECWRTIAGSSFSGPVPRIQGHRSKRLILLAKTPHRNVASGYRAGPRKTTTSGMAPSELHPGTGSPPQNPRS